jgi:short-subunit dehydrogenase
MNNVALVTGASGGIGLELARLHAKDGGDLLLVARSGDKLDLVKFELESVFGVSVKIYVADLTEAGVPQAIFDFAKTQGIEVELLINNAGFGGHGKFHQRDWDQEESMIALNVTALCELTHLFVGDMVKRKHGKILNVASTAGFLPGPMMATYYATKAFVVSFSQAIAEELRSDGITVTALCPGPVKTGFARVADLEDVDTFKNAASATEVARIGYRAMKQGKLVAIDDWKLRLLLYWVVPFLPRTLVLKLSRKTMAKD